MHKQDRRIRLCIQLHDVNSKTITERYPMPNLHIHKVLSQPESAKEFTIIVLGFAYHQIRLTDKSKDILLCSQLQKVILALQEYPLDCHHHL